jgi:hypothetical protein
VGDKTLDSLRAALDEAERRAKAADPGPWEFEGDDPTDDELYTVHDLDATSFFTVAFTRGRNIGNGRHMEFWDPLRVQAIMGAVRAIIAESEGEGHGWAEHEPSYYAGVWFAVLALAEALTAPQEPQGQTLPRQATSAARR